MESFAEPTGSQLSKIVLRLGGFHTEMSFLGCIGHLMASSGLQELLEMIYASNVVVHMLTGKAIARAVRGHFIIDAALNAMILSRIYHVSDVDTESFEELAEKEVLDEAAILFDKLNKGVVSAEDICKNVILSEINTALKAQKELVKSSRTAMQWLIFFGSIYEQSVQATGNCTYKLFQKCSLIWQLLATTTTLSQD